MRRIFLSGSFLTLLVMLLALWAYRFEQVPGSTIWQLADLRDHAPSMPGVEWSASPDQPKLRLHVDPAGSQVAARFAIPNVPALTLIHLNFRLTAHGLTRGPETWQDGRMMIEWHSPDTLAVLANDPVGSVKGDEQETEEDLVLKAPLPTAIPMLRLEHLGLAGDFELSDLTITMVTERPLWKIGQWAIAFAWLAWGVACVRSWPGISAPRAIFASTIWLLMAIFCVVPGPWKIQRSMVPAYQLNSDHSDSRTPNPLPAKPLTKETSLLIPSSAVPALGKIPNQGPWILQARHRLAQARPLLHALLLFGPSLAWVFLLGKRPTWFLASLLSLATELAQLAFGFGFNWLDVGDLASDACGVALAIWIYQKIHRNTTAQSNVIPRPA